MPPADADSAVALDPATSVKSDEDPSMVVGDSDTDSGVVTVDSDVDSGVAAISNDPDSSAASPAGDANSEAAQMLDVIPAMRDRKSVVLGKSVSGRVDLGGRSIIRKTKHNKSTLMNSVTHTYKYNIYNP